MVLTPWDGMNVLHDNVSPSDALQTKIYERTELVADLLKRAFPSGSDMEFRSATLIGSAGRGTASKPITDLDLLVHLHVDQGLWDSSYAVNSQPFLYRVRDSINDASAVQKVGARSQAVRIFYSDGLIVDVAAVEARAGGGYLIPDGAKGWMPTNPYIHAQHIEQKQSDFNGHFKRFVQVIKQWNRAHGNHLGSFHLEMMAARTFTSLSNNRRTAIRTFFEINYNNLSVDDPAGFSGDLSAYLTPSARESVNQNMLTGYRYAVAANDAEDRGDHREAVRIWKIVLGDDFPTYG